MKRHLTSFLCLLFILSLLLGCGQKEEAQESEPAVGQPEELADSTRLDSARPPGAVVPDTTAADPGTSPDSI